jgi:predicted nucleic acid-binding Zn ribbon protein
MQKFSDLPLLECPDCQKPVKKLMSLGSFALKGKGWYTTDYKKSAPSAASSAAAAPAASGSPGSSASTSPSGAGAATPAAAPPSSASPVPAKTAEGKKTTT